MKQGIIVGICCIVHLILGGYFLLIAVRGEEPQVIGFAATATVLYIQLTIGDAILLPDGGFKILLIALGTLSLIIGAIFWIWLFFSGNGIAAVEAICIFSAGQICKPRLLQEYAVFMGLLLWAFGAIGQIFLYFYFLYNRPSKSMHFEGSKPKDVLDFSSVSYESHGTPSLTCTSTLSAENDKVMHPAMAAISPSYGKLFHDKTWGSTPFQKSLKRGLMPQFPGCLSVQTDTGPFYPSRKLRSMRRWKQLASYSSPLYTTWYMPFYSARYPYFYKKQRSFLNLKMPLINLHFPKNRETIVEGPGWNTWDFSGLTVPIYPEAFSWDGLNLNNGMCNREESCLTVDTPDASFDSQMTQGSCFRKFFEQDLNKMELKNDCTMYSCMDDMNDAYK
ncbi:hypothetical protein PCANB_000717 [Pneumocystis canis]|nr:hypothetical protein PCK1_000765 [Pneumocystis canis]KAG5437680.1 hypothetical protein PCANB_000717 [Pneumocystis canis]